MAKDNPVLSHLFIAAPELLLEDAFVNYLHRRGYITNEGLETIHRLQASQAWVAKVRRKVKNKPLVHRLIALAPEVVNRKTIDLLNNLGKIDNKQAAVFRVWLGISERSSGGLPKNLSASIKRAQRMFGFGFVDDLLALMVVTDQIEKREAGIIRAEMLGGKVFFETTKSIVKAKSLYEMLTLIGSGLVDKRTIEAMRLSGIIDSRTANSLLLALSYGRSQWTVFEGAKKAEGLAARAAYMLSGSFSFEMVEFLKSMKFLAAEQQLLLEIGTSISQRYNRVLMEQMTDRKFRVIPGESPIASYARASKETDNEILRLLAQASKRASNEAEALALRGRAVRSAEYALRARALHQAMRQVWEGTGYLTIFGEKKVADAAISASEALQARYLGHLPEATRLMLERQARSGIDSFISRRENTLELSRRVYGNYNIWTRKIDKEINLGLLTGKSAKEIAKSVEKMINPSVMGGVKYAAMRLGRTELANSFHYTTIRHTREMPWVQAYKWNKSSSHRHGDVCDGYADDDHDGLGPGVFKKKNVPGKPHPQCLCYLTVVTMNDEQWLKAFNAGRFNQYINMNASNTPEDELRNFLSGRLGQAVGRAAGQVAVSQSMRLANRMASPVGKGRVNPSFNPVSPAADIAAVKNRSLFEKTIIVDAAPDVDVESKAADKALARFQKKAAKEEAKFQARKREYLDVDRARYYGKRQNADYDLESYHEMLSPDSGLQGGRPEEFSRSMYGTTSYRLMNENLRLAKGRLKEYESRFGDAGSMLEDLNSIDPEDPETWNITDGLIKRVGKAFGIKVEQGPYGPGFVEDTQNSGWQYWRSVQNLTMDEGGGEADWKSPFTKHGDIIRSLDGQMEAVKGNRMTFRITGNDWFGLDRDLGAQDVGRVFTDHAYTSTEGLPKYYGGQGNDVLMLKTDRRPNRVKVYLPDGTKAMRLNDFEYEVLLSRGSTFQVMSVTDSDSEHFLRDVAVMLVKQKNLKTHRKEETDEDMWDSLMGQF